MLRITTNKTYIYKIINNTVNIIMIGTKGRFFKYNKKNKLYFPYFMYTKKLLFILRILHCFYVLQFT